MAADMYPLSPAVLLASWQGVTHPTGYRERISPTPSRPAHLRDRDDHEQLSASQPSGGTTKVEGSENKRVWIYRSVDR